MVINHPVPPIGPNGEPIEPEDFDARYVKKAGDTMTGYLDFANDGQGLHFYGGGAIYKRTGLGMILQKSSGGQQWLIENADGTGGTPVLVKADADKYYEAIGKCLPLTGGKVTGELEVEGDLHIHGDHNVDTPKLIIKDQDSDERYWLRTETPSGGGSSSFIGDIKQSLATEDHSGWIILNGRAVSTLSEDQQLAASGILGFTTNIPDATGCVLMQGPNLGQVSGSNSRTLTQANLPVVNLTSDQQGLHRHTMRSVENDNGKQNLQNLFMGKYDNNEQLWNGGMDGATINNENYPQIGAAMEGAGAHTHSVPLGGLATPLDITPKSLSINMFIYLGS